LGPLRAQRLPAAALLSSYSTIASSDLEEHVALAARHPRVVLLVVVLLVDRVEGGLGKPGSSGCGVKVSQSPVGIESRLLN
jgi:hypothetical protein